jgi:hypothetical protein
MKKVLLSLSVLAVTGVFAQKNQRVLKAQEVQLKAPTTINNATLEKNLTVLWSDDFSNPTTWTIDNSGQTGANFGWNINSTSQGWWSTAGTGMSSTGISGGNNAELSNGNPTTNPGTQALGVTYTLTSALPIDVAGLTDGSNQVSLQFHQFGARFNDLQEFQISTNGTDFITVGNNNDKEVLSQAGGSAYPNPELKIVNLAPYLGSTANLSTVWIRFRWTTNFPSAATNPNVWVAYGWYIDDVKIVANPGFDAQVVSNFWGSEGLNYYQIPTTQVAPIEFSSRLFNAGTNVLPDAKLNVQVLSGANTAFSGSSAGQAVNPLDSATLELATTFTPPATQANYTLKRNVSLGNQPNGIVLTGTLTEGGSGYTSTNSVAVTGGSGTGLTLNTTATANGQVSTITLENAGTGYTSGSNVEVIGQGNGLTVDIVANPIGEVQSVGLNMIVSGFSDGPLTLIPGGSTVVGEGLVLEGLTDGNGNLTSVNIVSGGLGYNVGDAFLVVDNQTGGEAVLTVQSITNGEITSVVIANPGSGYSVGSGFSVFGGDASIEITAVSGGVITTASIATPGTGYTAGDVVTIDGGSATFTINTVTNNTPIVDEIPANNTIADLNFSVTNYIYARDNNNFAGSTTNGTDGFEVGNLFDIFAPQTLKGIAFRLAGGNNGTTVGTEVYVKLYGISATGEFEFIEESAPLIVGAGNLNSVVTLPLLSPVDLEPTTYLAVVGAFGGGMRVSNAGTSEQQTSFFLDLADNTWYFTTSTPVVRLNFDPIVSVNEQEMNVQSAIVYPNPTSTDATVKFNLNNASDVAVSVYDVTGKLMMNSALGNLNAGTHQMDVAAKDWNSGVYFVNITSNGTTVTKKFVRQ